MGPTWFTVIMDQRRRREQFSGAWIVETVAVGAVEAIPRLSDGKVIVAAVACHHAQ